MPTESKQGYCTLCRSRCGTVNEVRGDMLISVRPDPSHPTGEAMCMKGKSAPELVHSPHRLQTPLRRTNPKGSPDPGWVRISWEEALAETARRLGTIRAESGAESVVFSVTTPSGTPLSDSIDWIERFVRLFGSPNICYATEVCNWHKDYAHAFTFGCGMPPADYAEADLIVLWGHNPANTWLAQASAIGKGRMRGAKMVVVDPRPTALARQADVWLPVRPGTDAAVALGLIHLLIAQGRYDDAFVRDWTNGPLLVRSDNGQFLREQDVWPVAVRNRFLVWNDARHCVCPYDTEQAAQPQQSADFRLRGAVTVDVCGAAGLVCHPAFELLAQASAHYGPREVESITGVPAASLHAAAALFGSLGRIAYHAWTGIGQHANATQSERAVATLYALTGSFDRIGGNRVRIGPPINAVNALSLLGEAQRKKALGIDERPIGPPAHGWVTARDTYRAILEGRPYKVRAMVAFGTNLPVSQADTSQARQAFSELEFHVHCDLFETPAARYADIFLPVNTPWEREGLRVGFEISDRAAGWVQLRQQMVPPRGESRSDNDIVFDLACRLGLGDEFFGGSVQAGWDHILAPTGISVEQLRQRPEGIACPVDAGERKYARPTATGVRGFATPTRRVELYSENLLRHRQPPLAAFVEPADTPRDLNATQGRFPYVLSSAKNGFYCHSQHRSLTSLRKRAPDPIAELSPVLANAKGILDGDWIRIRTRVGQARFVARITPQLADGVVVAEFGWWQGCPELDRDGLSTEGLANSNFNSLISADHHDPVSGSSPLRSFLCDVESDPLIEVRQRKWAGYRDFRVSELRREADGVLGIHFEPLDDVELPDYRPGQHIEIKLDGGDGTPISRAYSLTGPAAVPHRRRYSIAVRHQKGLSSDGTPFEGRMSGVLHRRLRVGDVVSLRSPAGGWVVPRQSPQPLLLFAGGIGITPFLSLLESLPDGADGPEIWLYYANQNSGTHAFRERIAHHRARLPRLHVYDYYAAPLPGDREGVDFTARRYVDASVVDDALIERRARIYLCGPPAMMEAVTNGLVARGVPRFDIFSELFRSPSTPPSGNEAFNVSFSRSRRDSVKWTPRQGTLLTFAESLGVQMASGCRVGQCESCAVRLVSGKVRHLHGSEPDDPGICLACQAIPVEDVVLDA